MISTLNKSNYSKLSLYITILLYGVDFSTYFAEYVSVSVLKVITYLIALALMCFEVNGKRKHKYMSFVWKMWLFYMFLIFCRLMIDFVLPQKGFFLYKNPLTIIYFFLMTMLIPLLFFGKIRVSIDSLKWAKYTGALLLICLLITSYNNLYGNATATLQGQYRGEGTIDIISYGHYGCSLILLGLYINIIGKQRNKRLLFVLFGGVGFLSMILSGSRSPFIALSICSLLLFTGKMRTSYVLIIIALLFALSISLLSSYIIQFNMFLEAHNIFGFNRILNSTILLNGDLDSSGRDEIFNWGWKLFLENPLTGSSYLLPDGSYVHNIFIEQFMGLGVLGGGLFIVLNARALYCAWFIIIHHPQYSLFPILFIQYLILGFFSRTIIALAPYWLFLFLTLNYYEQMKVYGKNFSNHTHV